MHSSVILLFSFYNVISFFTASEQLSVEAIRPIQVQPQVWVPPPPPDPPYPQ